MVGATTDRTTGLRPQLVFTKDKSIAAVNTAVHRSKLTIAAVNQNSTVTWLALRRRGRGRGLERGRSPFPSSNIITYSVIAAGVSGLLQPTPVPRMCANIYISFFTVYSGVLLFGARHLADFIITYLPPRKSCF